MRFQLNDHNSFFMEVSFGEDAAGKRTLYVMILFSFGFPMRLLIAGGPLVVYVLTHAHA